MIHFSLIYGKSLVIFSDNDPLVTRLKSTRKVMTEAMRHGVMFEPIAANAYSSVSKLGTLNLIQFDLIWLRKMWLMFK